MTQQDVRRLNTFVSLRNKQLAYLVAIPAAIVLLIAFVLPWITILDHATELGTATGLQIAQGIDDAEVKGAAPFFDAGANLYLLLIPALAVVSLVLTGANLYVRQSPGLLAEVTWSRDRQSGVIIFKFLHTQLDVTNVADAGDRLINFDYSAGWWLTIAAAVVMVAAAGLILRAEAALREKPGIAWVTRGLRQNSLQVGIVSVMVILWFAFVVGSPKPSSTSRFTAR